MFSKIDLDILTWLVLELLINDKKCIENKCFVYLHLRKKRKQILHVATISFTTLYIVHFTLV